MLEAPRKLNVELGWQMVGVFDLKDGLPIASSIDDGAGVYRIRFLDTSGHRRHAYVGETQHLDQRVGSEHGSGPLRPFIIGTIEAGGTVEVDVLATRNIHLPEETAELRLDRQLSRVALEGAAIVQEMNTYDDLLNAERVVDDALPAEVRNRPGWWLAN